MRLGRLGHARSHLTHPALTQIKPLATSGKSVKSRFRLPRGDRIDNRSRKVAKKIILDAVLYNFVRSDVYSVYRVGSPLTSSVQM